MQATTPPNSPPSRIIAGLAVAMAACGGAEKNPDFCEVDQDCEAGEQCSLETNTCIANSRLTLDTTDFFDDGTRLFTAQSGPLLRGTFEATTDPVIRAFVGSTLVGPEATIDGTTWSLQLPEGTIPRDDVPVHVQLVGGGRTTEIVELFALDDEAPVVAIGETLVRDERGDVIDFSTGVPIHDHAGATVLLAGSGCPEVYKHAYLMDENAPEFGGEVAPNPMAWTFRVTERAGLDFTRSRYRVRDTTSNEVLLDFTPVPETPLGADIVIPIHRRGAGGIAALGDGPRELEIDVVFVDWAGHEAMTTTACWNHIPLAAPMHLQAPRNSAGHDLALDSLSLTGVGDDFAGRVLNATASTSLTDLPFANETAEPVVLTIDVTKPSRVDQTQTFALQNFLGSPTNVNLNCGPATDPNTFCDPPPAGPSILSSRTVSDPVPFFVKLFETDAAGVPVTEVPCIAPCSQGGSRFRFAIPPRATGEVARSYVAMTMIGQIPGLWPQDPAQPATAPFENFTLGGTTLTGKKGTPLAPGCTRTTIVAGNMICTERRANTPYRALTSARLALVGNLVTVYSVGVNATIAPTRAQQANRANGYSTTEGPLP